MRALSRAESQDHKKIILHGAGALGICNFWYESLKSLMGICLWIFEIWIEDVRIVNSFIVLFDDLIGSVNRPVMILSLFCPTS